MGAFDGELYRLGYRFPSRAEREEVPQEVLDRRKAVAEMHLAVMPCPGSCGSACANHHCAAHNDQQFEKSIKPRILGILEKLK
jgi:hypothetical protein